MKTIEDISDGIEDGCLLSEVRLISSEIRQELKNECQKKLCVALRSTFIHTYSAPYRQSVRQGPMRRFISGFCFTATASWEREVCQ